MFVLFSVAIEFAELDPSEIAAAVMAVGFVEGSLCIAVVAAAAVSAGFANLATGFEENGWYIVAVLEYCQSQWAER